MESSDKPDLEYLEPLVGEWSVEAIFPGAPPSDQRGHTTFEWGPGAAFLVQLWEGPTEDFPTGIAIIARDQDSGALIQHYFDSRGVVRQYEMSFEAGAWSLRRTAPGFSQRFSGRLGPDGKTIEGAWEICKDDSTWELDFDLVYRRIG